MAVNIFSHKHMYIMNTLYDVILDLYILSSTIHYAWWMMISNNIMNRVISDQPFTQTMKLLLQISWLEVLECISFSWINLNARDVLYSQQNHGKMHAF